MDYNTMLDHQKVILEHVTENDELFLKELKKSISWLAQDDIMKLYNWLKDNFWEVHQDEIEMAFGIA
jgi:hypothetical protein